MRVNNFTIRIKRLEDILSEAKNVMKKLSRGKKVGRHEGISFDSIDDMRRILTEERLNILKTIKNQQPGSIYELAKLLGRDNKYTFDDVQLLAEMGLIELRKAREGRERTTPRVTYNQILLEIPV